MYFITPELQWGAQTDSKETTEKDAETDTL